MRYEMTEELEQPRLDQAWATYSAAFDELRAATVERNVMYRHEFDVVMLDKRIEKHYAVDPAIDRVVALATFTNALDALTWLSPEYFAARWPDQFAKKQIWYLGFFAIHPEYRHSGIFEAVITQMWRPIHASGGVAALDICGVNISLGLAGAITRTLKDLTPAMVTEEIDVQTYWAFSLDAPA
ncbi:hypothetical protein AB0M47_21760 [Hamadaea sp. NPDC051192]|uniref:hypothetical protein n=1 Tax=Hamadaea sp. NPDC051192 TaxID=3154940 RepID=UPI003414238D